MDQRIKELAEMVANQFGLEQYVLKRHHLCREKNSLQENIPILTLEYFPKEQQQDETEDLNPPGTAVIDIAIPTKTITRVIFVNDISFANNRAFPTPDMETILEWIESVTGLVYGRQFRLQSKVNKRYLFQAAIDNIAVKPGGSIEIAFNDHEELTLFSMDGVFPEEDRVEWEPFSLTADNVIEICKAHCIQMDIPLERKKTWLSVFAMEELYIANDRSHILTEEEVHYRKNTLKMDLSLEWDQPAPIEEDIPREALDPYGELSPGEAFGLDPDPESSPITEKDQEKCTDLAIRFLQKHHPNASGQWKLHVLRREIGHLVADIVNTANRHAATKHAIQLFIDPESYRISNWFDNGEFIKLFASFSQPGKLTISKEDAFPLLWEHAAIIPTYVFDMEAKKYRLFGKIVCPYAVDATNGKLQLWHDLEK